MLAIKMGCGGFDGNFLKLLKKKFKIKLIFKVM